MIDVHAHIVPGVDDGPRNLEEAMEMIAMANEDGIKTIICTPHRNHPGDFEGKEKPEEAYEELRKAVKETYPEMKLHLGCELYISKDYLEILDQKPYPFTINKSRYILTEFPRTIKKSELLDIIHEIRIRDYIPVIAHAEVYPELMTDISSITQLRTEGACIQITASSLLGKLGSEIAGSLKQLTALGQIDFIATDAHSSERRKPILSKARDYVSSRYGKAMAQAIFDDNPAAMLKNQDLKANPAAVKKRRTQGPCLNLIASVFAVVLIGAGIMLLFAERDEAKAVSKQEIAIMQQDEGRTQEEKLRSELERREAETGQSEDTAKDKAVQSTELSSKDQKSEQQIVQSYTIKLEALQQEYETSIAEIAGQIKVARESIEDQDERKRIIDSYISDAADLESRSDNDVSHALYEMQNELEDAGGNIESVQELRDQYQQIKAEKKNYYIEMLR